ncbi:UNVERIFIED_ORG: hypothetical protein J2Y77_001174 [Pseudomonas lini]
MARGRNAAEVEVLWPALKNAAQGSFQPKTVTRAPPFQIDRWLTRFISSSADSLRSE